MSKSQFLQSLDQESQRSQNETLKTAETKLTLDPSLGSTTANNRSYQESRYDNNFKSAHQIMNIGSSLLQRQDSQLKSKVSGDRHYLPKLNKFCEEASLDRLKNQKRYGSHQRFSRNQNDIETPVPSLTPHGKYSKFDLPMK